MSISSIPILPVKTISGNQWVAHRLIEEIGQTFLLGTPVMITSSDGGLTAWGGTSGTNGTLSQAAICGICYEAASNLGATGKGAPKPLQPVTGLGATLTFGSVPNESSAYNIPHGAPLNDGRCGYFAAAADTIFSALFGNNGAQQQPLATDVGQFYGLTIDSNSAYWYVDKNKNTQGTNTCVKIVGLDLRDQTSSGVSTRVLFQFDARYVNVLA